MAKLSEIYRLQNSIEKPRPFICKQYPVKRVLVSDDGKIDFNPDHRNFIYFSSTKDHHAYYLRKKIFGIINSEIKRVRSNPAFAKLDIPEHFSFHLQYNLINHDVIKKVKNLFQNHLPPHKVELVTLQFIDAFRDLFLLCATKNTTKNCSRSIPEVSDQSFYGGGYGINDVWLKLLRDCTVTSEIRTLEITKFLDLLTEASKSLPIYDTKKSELRQNLKDIRSQIITDLDYIKLDNPQFRNKEHLNNIIHSLEEIEESKLYAKHLNLNREFFAKQHRRFKSQVKELI